MKAFVIKHCTKQSIHLVGLSDVRVYPGQSWFWSVNAHVKDSEKRFICDYEGCKQSYTHKDYLYEHFVSHFTGDLTCKNYGKTYGFKDILKNHLLSHKTNSNLNVLMKVMTKSSTLK